MALSPDGRTLAVLGAEKAVPLWEAATGQRSLELRGSLTRSLTGAFTADGQRLATAGSDGTIRVWDVPRGAVRE